MPDLDMILNTETHAQAAGNNRKPIASIG